MFSDLGSQVTVLEALPVVCSPGATRTSCRRRSAFVSQAGDRRLHRCDGERALAQRGGDDRQLRRRESVTVDAVVLSVGRRPLTEGLLAEGTGVTLDDRGYVVVDEYQRTAAEGVWAVGDVVNTPQLADVGFAEGILAIKLMLGEVALPVDYARVPWSIYCHPEVAFAGLTEVQAKEAGIDVVANKDPYGGNSRARILGETDGLVKVIAERLPDGRAGRILGVHMVGPWVTEQLGQGYMAVNWEATPEEIGQFIQPHPTLSEAFGETVLALTGRGLHVG